MTLLSSEEQAIIDQVIHAIRGKNGTDLSTETHEEMGWKMVDVGETIPMSSAYLATSMEVTPRIQDHARRLAQRLGISK